MLSLCELNRDAIRLVTAGLVHADLTAAEQGINQCDVVESLRERCEHTVMTVLATQAPVAGDLRLVVTAVHLVSDLGRMAGLARHVGEAVRRRHPDPVATGPLLHILARMGAAAEHLAVGAGEVVASRDPRRAAQLHRDDDILDDLHRDLLAAMVSPAWIGDTRTAVDVTLIGRFYERFGDHAASVGRRMIFLVTGASLAELA